MTDEQLLEVIGERTKNRDKLEQARIAIRSVVGCFNSRAESNTCIEDHHPSCREYLVFVLAKLEEDK